MAPVRRPQARGDQHVEWLAEYLRSGVAERLLGGRIEHDDPLLTVNGDDRIHRRFDDVGEAVARARRRLLPVRRCVRSFTRRREVQCDVGNRWSWTR